MLVVLVVLLSLGPVVVPAVDDIVMYCEPALRQWLQRVVTMRREGWCVVLL